MNTDKTIGPHGSVESLDLNKLNATLRSNIWWILAIFVSINLGAYLIIRYSKNIYESKSQLKLDIKNDATELGFKPLIEDQNLNVISGEIELIQSSLFLSRLLDSMNLSVGYYNSGEILNFEFFGNLPYEVRHNLVSGSFLNTPVFIDESNNSFRLTLGESGQSVNGQFGVPLTVPGGTLTIIKNDSFGDRSVLNSFFIIHSRDVLLNYLSENLKVQPLNFNANTIQISFTDHNPYKAAAIVNEIDSLYLMYSNEQKNLANKQKIDWLNQELKNIEEQMSGFEDYFEDFILTNKTNDLDKELQRTVEMIMEIDSQRFILTRNIDDIDRALNNLATGNYYVAGSLSRILPQAVAVEIKTLEERQMELERTKLTYSDVTFAVKQQEHLIQESQTNVSKQLQELKKNWLVALKDLNQRKQRLEDRFIQMPDRNTEFSKNQRFYKLYEQFYLTLMQSKSEFEIAKAGSTPDFKILSPASLSANPIAPNKLMIVGIGLVASLVSIFFLVGILYLANNKITSGHDLESLNAVPMLGAIPLLKDTTTGEIHVVNHPKSMVSEAFRTLRTNLDFIAGRNQLRSIVISSTISGEGKSFVALNLGAVLALSKKRVILLDLDLRKTKTNLPGNLQNNERGVSTILIRRNTWQECVVGTQLEGLDYLPSGPHPPNPSELLLNGEFEALLGSLKDHYDYLVMDTPPVGLVTDAIMAMKHADVSIYVARANYSKKEFLSNIRRIISINKFPNICSLLNALPNRKTPYGYGYYEEPGAKGKQKREPKS